jgi:undecaprenyl-diphosphatase
MSIPVIGGAALLKSMELVTLSEPVPWAMLGGAMLFAGLSAYACIALFLRFIERVGMMPFVVYRIALAVVLAVLWWS